MVNDFLMDVESLLGVLKIFGTILKGWLHHTVNVPKTTEFYTFK